MSFFPSSALEISKTAAESLKKGAILFKYAPNKSIFVPSSSESESLKPATVIPMPDVVTSKPDAVTLNPDTEGLKPAILTPKSVTVTLKPDVVTPKPDAEALKPVSVTLKPDPEAPKTATLTTQICYINIKTGCSNTQA